METNVLIAELVPTGVLAELLSEVHPCGCLSTPDYGYLPCTTCRTAAAEPLAGDIIDAEFEVMDPDDSEPHVCEDGVCGGCPECYRKTGEWFCARACVHAAAF